MPFDEIRHTTGLLHKIISFIEFMARCLLNHFLAVEDYKFLVVEDYYLLGVLLPLDYIRILSLSIIFFLHQLTH